MKRKPTVIIAIALGLAVLWVLVRPGVFTVQPIGALPKGVTIVYYGRSSELSFFSSPDSMCLDMQGGVSLLCRGIALGAAVDLLERKIIQLPYQEWAYLLSTEGSTFYR